MAAMMEEMKKDNDMYCVDVCCPSLTSGPLNTSIYGHDIDTIVHKMEYLDIGCPTQPVDILPKTPLISYLFNNHMISPWHDITLQDKTQTWYHFICEIPKWTRQKMEMDVDDRNHRIKQDTLPDGSLRYYTHGDIFFNYGFMPQTWENPKASSKWSSYPGDGDPLDCIEIGLSALNMGGAYRVKVLGCLGMIDEGCTDWKLIVIQENDPLASSIHNLEDCEKWQGGLLDSIRTWFKFYKYKEKGIVNTFLFDGAYQDTDTARDIILECHREWRKILF